MTNVQLAGIDDFLDIEARGYYTHAVAEGMDPGDVVASMRPMTRDNARTPMQWDAGEHGGFTTGTPWMPLNPNYDEINAEAAVADPDSVFHHYRRLIDLRHAEPAVALGDFTMLLEDDERVYAFTRRLEDTELLVIANFSGEDAVAGVDPAWLDAELVLGNLPDAPDLTLRPWEARVYRHRIGR
jgi:oligo-1,6-glucosidase